MCKDPTHSPEGGWDVIGQISREAIKETQRQQCWAWMAVWLSAACALALIFAVTHVDGYAWFTPPLIIVTAVFIRPGGGPAAPSPAPDNTAPTAPTPAAEPT